VTISLTDNFYYSDYSDYFDFKTFLEVIIIFFDQILSFLKELSFI